MRKIWTIAQKELYETYSDRNLLLIMIVTPVALATIIGLALGNTTGDTAPIQDIPVAIVNLDAGGPNGNFGSIFVTTLIPDAQVASDSPTAVDCEGASSANSGDFSFSLEDLTEAEQLNDPSVARAAVEAGDYAAAIIIPADFSERLTYTQDNPDIDPVSVEVYANAARSISGEIIRSITEGITNQIVTGNIAVAATLETLTERAQTETGFGINFLLLNLLDGFQPDFACAFDPDFNNIQLEQRTLDDEANSFNPLVYFGSANAMFFLLFTAQGSATSILADRRQGVLQRLIVSPTPRLTILLGKLMGTFLIGVVQLLLLFLAFTMVGSLLDGELVFIWGTNVPAILTVVVVASLSASGLGTILAAFAQSPEQSNVIGTTINIAMAALGGAFFSIPPDSFLASFQALSLVYWGTNAFTTLASGSTDILLNMLVLLLQGGLMFLVGLFAFNRRLREG